MAFLRLIVAGFVVLSIVYVVVLLYSRSTRREELEKQFDAGGIPGLRETYIEDGMRRYERSLRKRMIWLVYIIPMVVMAVTIYVVNHN